MIPNCFESLNIYHAFQIVAVTLAVDRTVKMTGLM